MAAVQQTFFWRSGSPGPASDSVLREDDFYVLREDGGKILREGEAAPSDLLLDVDNFPIFDTDGATIAGV